MIVQNPLIGRARKSLANSTFTTLRGQNVVKSKPLSVANPRTAGQTAQRALFSSVIALARVMMSDIKRSFKESAGIQSEYNVFTSENLKAAKAATSLETAILNGTAVFAKGTLLAVGNPEVSSAGGSDMALGYDDNTNGTTGLSTDVLNYAAFNAEGELIQGGILPKTRTGSPALLVGLQDYWESGCSVYAWFTRASEGKASDSKRAEEV